MPLMHKLPNKVYEDIWEEEWKEISKTKKILNLSKFKQAVSKRCLIVLKQMITNQTIIGEGL